VNLSKYNVFFKLCVVARSDLLSY